MQIKFLQTARLPGNGHSFYNAQNKFHTHEDKNSPEIEVIFR